MDLWVRTQDKRRIIKVFDVNITGTNKIYITANFKRHYSGCDYVDLGKYDSASRALEVLDEIQEAQLGNFNYRCPSNVKVSNNEDTIVYEMPSK